MNKEQKLKSSITKGIQKWIDGKCNPDDPYDLLYTDTSEERRKSMKRTKRAFIIAFAIYMFCFLIIGVIIFIY